MLEKRLPLVTLFCMLQGSLFAQESFDALEGFEELQTQEVVAPAPTQSGALTLSGKATFKSSYGTQAHKVDNVEYSGVTQAQSGLYLQLDYKLSSNWSARVSGDGFYDAYYDLSEQKFNDDVLNAYQAQLRFDDLYLQGKLSQNLDAKIGRQIVVWGKSDSIRVTDVINPLDNRLPGMTDIKDLRLSTAMAKFDFYSGAWNISAMLIPESRVFLEPAPRGEFFPVDAAFPSAPNPFFSLETPANGFDDINAMQCALAINGAFSGWDLSFYGADVLDSRWHITRNLPYGTREVSKIQMLGSALNLVSGSWLFKSEAAFVDNLLYNSTEAKKSRLDVLIGFDYMGIAESVFSLEIANRHIFEHETRMSQRVIGIVPDFVQEDELQTALRATRSFDNDRLNTTLLLNMLGHNWEYGGFARASLAYDIQDGIVANIGIIEYIAPYDEQKRPLVDAISNNQRFFADISYSF